MTADVELGLEDRFVVEAFMFGTRRALEIFDRHRVVQHGGST
jgi:hypothetical protein